MMKIRKNSKQRLSKGSLPSSAKIGGLIEIHGNGGKGIDWTEGCIALTDTEMDIVFKTVKVGTPVTIVGSMVESEGCGGQVNYLLWKMKRK